MGTAKEPEFELLGTGWGCVCARDTGVGGIGEDGSSYQMLRNPNAGTEHFQVPSICKRGPSARHAFKEP